jgi:hypothetical protein
MRNTPFAVVAASLLVAACATDSSTTLGPDGSSDPRLSAVAAAPVADLESSMVTMKIAVTSSLPESVSGGVCASAVEARTAASSTWTDVTSSSYACPAIAAVLTPGSTLTLTAAADPARIRAVAGSSATVLLRVRSSLNGSSVAYVLQSNEVTYQLP